MDNYLREETYLKEHKDHENKKEKEEEEEVKSLPGQHPASEWKQLGLLDNREPALLIYAIHKLVVL